MIDMQFSDLLEGKTGTLFLPINVGAWHGAAVSAPSHWILLVIDTVARRVVTMDSYSGSSYKKEVALIRKRAQLVCSNDAHHVSMLRGRPFPRACCGA